ncbi:hypothetical protein [Streptomyces sp. NPDC093598]|uniref:hypothetical protein n=1 Tax=Streptomyces sp. NPDC093598 TaxID=3366046 RepID=UPI003808AD5C
MLAKHGRPVVEDLEVEKSTVPDRIYEYLAQQRDLVDVSIDLAELLFESQKGRSPAGLLLVAAARLAGKRALLIVKLEQEGGLRAEDVLVEGKRTFDMSYFADLLMTEHNKIYKAALFCVDGVPEDGPIEGGRLTSNWSARWHSSGCRHSSAAGRKRTPNASPRSFTR